MRRAMDCWHVCLLLVLESKSSDSNYVEAIKPYQYYPLQLAM